MNMKCDMCSIELIIGIYEYSTRWFKKPLCRNCQEKIRIERMTPEFRSQYLKNTGRK